jgi:hypothetical protein
MGHEGALSGHESRERESIMVTASGTSGDDTLYGGSVDDLLGGSGGNDLIFGNEGNDSISGVPETIPFRVEPAMT